MQKYISGWGRGFWNPKISLQTRHWPPDSVVRPLRSVVERSHRVAGRTRTTETDARTYATRILTIVEHDCGLDAQTPQTVTAHCAFLNGFRSGSYVFGEPRELREFSFQMYATRKTKTSRSVFSGFYVRTRIIRLLRNAGTAFLHYSFSY